MLGRYVRGDWYTFNDHNLSFRSSGSSEMLRPDANFIHLVKVYIHEPVQIDGVKTPRSSGGSGTGTNVRSMAGIYSSGESGLPIGPPLIQTPGTINFGTSSGGYVYLFPSPISIPAGAAWVAWAQSGRFARVGHDRGRGQEIELGMGPTGFPRAVASAPWTYDPAGLPSASSLSFTLSAYGDSSDGPSVPLLAWRVV